MFVISSSNNDDVHALYFKAYTVTYIGITIAIVLLSTFNLNTLLSLWNPENLCIPYCVEWVFFINDQYF